MDGWEFVNPSAGQRKRLQTAMIICLIMAKPLLMQLYVINLTLKTRLWPKRAVRNFIARNRAPRVQIEYDVESTGQKNRLNCPMVMGVMADLSGKPAEALPDVATASAWKSTWTTSTTAQGLQAARRLPGAQHADRRRAISLSR